VTAATLEREVRPEIQALRAVAVALVLVYHWWPSALPGGFVGVDVFFAISGYLITAHLLREVDATGRVSLLGFWARRARRILPAALLVLLFCTLATIAFVARLHWQPFLTEIRASALYVENWHLANAAVDYQAADDAPSPVQHYWSLSAEEQFYVAWPVLILAGAAIGRRAIGLVLGVVTLGSLAWSVYLTATDPVVAFFVTPTRAWEFGAGGLLAFAPAAARSRVALSWAGLAAIAIAGVAFSAATPFPGAAALLPVLGTVAVIWAAAPTAPLRWRPVQLLGDISYSVYLWHWPLLVLVPIVLDRAMTTAENLLLLAVTLFLGWVTKVVVEDPVRRGSFLVARRPVWTFATMGVGTVAVLALATTGERERQRAVVEARQGTLRILERPPSCFGAAARDPERRCDDRGLRRTVVPSPIEARHSGNAPCTRVERTGLLNVCAFGARKAASRRTIALIGDSHASHWRAALDVVAEARRWRGLSLAHTDCPLSTAVRDIPKPRRSECVQWNHEVLAWLERNPEVTTIFVSQSVAGDVITAPGASSVDTQVEGYRTAWRRVPRSVRRIVVLRDTPRALPRGATLECVEEAMRERRDAGRACALPRTRALWRDPAVAAARTESPRVRTVDLTRFFCDARVCFAVVGGALVHRDVSHMTTVFGTTLGPYLLSALA
jgi:peptidoglycan/LPS O-acetylase OafA/YrhL